METTAIQALVSNAGSVVTSSIGWISQVCTAIGSNPLLLLFTIIPLVGLGVGLFARLKG